MRNLFTIIFILSCSYCFGQKNYLPYKMISEGKNSDFRFPIFSDSTDTLTAKKINQLLQLSELQILKGHEKKNIFEVVGPSEGSLIDGMVEITGKVFFNTNKVLSIQFNESSCGGACFYWVNYYNFNTGNGDIIQLRDLFTSEGYNDFYKMVAKKRIAQLHHEVAKLKKEVKDDFDEDITASYYRSDSLKDFYIQDTCLYIDGFNCLPKQDKADGIETVCKFRLSEFVSCLNDYGKCVFNLNQDSIATYHFYNSLPQIFYGTIGTQKVALAFFGNGESYYAYLKYGMAIKMYGRLKGNKVELSLKDEDDNNIESIETILNGNQITGVWYNKGKTKSLPVNLLRQ